MMIYKTLDELQADVTKSFTSSGDTVEITNQQLLVDETIDNLVYSAVFAEDESVKKEARRLIRAVAMASSVYPASIHEIYMAFGQGELSGFTVPAMNIRALTYDMTRRVFKLSQKHNIGTFIFEIAKSEQGYTDQKPDEFAVAILAAAVKEGYTGPVYLQGDHYQFKAKNFQADKQKEIDSIKTLIKNSIDAGFYNIDIDASTLVDLTKPSYSEQQKDNYEMSALLTSYIRGLQPTDTMISIGGEIGHIGGVNSNVKDFEAYMEGYLSLIKDKNLTGLSKVSVQTGTSHGGTVLPDGSIAEVNLDFNVLESIGKVAREKYHIGGPVQHGASTLPENLFNKFPQVQTLEIHLATGFQNIMYDNIPETLREEMHEWSRKNCLDEKKESWNDEQYVYKTRKKALGPFKKQLWHLPENEKKVVLDALEKQFEFLFEQLNVFGTKEKVEKYLK